MTMGSASPDQEKAIEQPKPTEYTGKWRCKRDGYLYKHCIKEHALGKDHKAIVEPQYRMIDGVNTMVHTGLFWEGTREEFKDQFEKE